MLTARHLAANLALRVATHPAALAHHCPIPWGKSAPATLTSMVLDERDGFAHREVSIRRKSGEELTIDRDEDFTVEKNGFSADGSDFPVCKAIAVEGYPPNSGWHRLQPTANIIDGVRYETPLHR